MDFADTQDEAAFRKRARRFLNDNAELKNQASRNLATGWNKDEALAAAKLWQAKKFDAGYAGLVLPTEYGGQGLSPIMQVIYNQEEENYVVPRGVYEIGLGMCIPTMLAYAKEEQKQRYSAPALCGEEIWCQLFSEPVGGSDLAGLVTRAEKKEDIWIINGQKI